MNVLLSTIALFIAMFSLDEEKSRRIFLFGLPIIISLKVYPFINGEYELLADEKMNDVNIFNFISNGEAFYTLCSYFLTVFVFFILRKIIWYLLKSKKDIKQIIEEFEKNKHLKKMLENFEKNSYKEKIHLYNKSDETVKDILEEIRNILSIRITIGFEFLLIFILMSPFKSMSMYIFYCLALMLYISITLTVRHAILLKRYYLICK